MEKKQYKYWFYKPIWKMDIEAESVFASDDEEAFKKYREGKTWEWEYLDSLVEHEEKPYIHSKEEIPDKKGDGVKNERREEAVEILD